MIVQIVAWYVVGITLSLHKVKTNAAEPTTIVNLPTPTPIINERALQLSPTDTFQDILINCGGDSYLENSGLRTWAADNYYTGGSTYSVTSVPVANTVDDPIYQSERVGVFSYSIPVPIGTYEVRIHLAELVLTGPNLRAFDLTIESQYFHNVDIVKVAGGPNRAVTMDAFVVVDDGFLTISIDYGSIYFGFARIDPKMNGIEVKRSLPHIAHSVSNGPYRAVDNDNNGFATVKVDGSESHTHGTGLVLNRWIWTKGSATVGTGAVTSLSLPVGINDITLTIGDNGGNEDTESTIVTVLPFGYPDIIDIKPSSGRIAGGERIFIVGSGFTYTTAQTTVYFGATNFTGAAITIHNKTTISVLSPAIPISIPVLVSVETPLERSDAKTFTYIATIPLVFDSIFLTKIAQPTSAEFGPDGKLYVGSVLGTLSKITFNADYTVIVAMVSAVVAPNRAILGMAFDPLDAGLPNPPVYISNSLLFHGESLSSFGQAINGKISRVIGANLDIVEDVITGLPVSDHDHAANQITFGNAGNLFITLGSNTNGGEPGPLSSKGTMKENYFAASIIEAKISRSTFDGFIEYDAPDDGNPIKYRGITIFAPGLRNPFGMTLHSNGKLYATDNGPNVGAGKMRVGCDPSDLLVDQQREDKLLHVIRNKYYGHPNPKRASRDNDPRQCTWRNPTEPTSADYQAPIGIILSSSTAIIEYKADHFNGQLRYNLIHVKFLGGLLRTVLSADGTSANPLTIPGIPLVGSNGLALAQAPNGNLVEARFNDNSLFVNVPIEAPTSLLKVNSVFPSRGGLAGGTVLRIYGKNFGPNPIVTVGGFACPLFGAATPTLLQCTLPGRAKGLVHVLVQSGTSSYTFKKGYRYITGF